MTNDYRTAPIIPATVIQEFAHEHETARRHPHGYPHQSAAPHGDGDVASLLGLPVSEVPATVVAALLPVLAELEQLRWQAAHADRREAEIERHADRHPVVACLHRRAFVREVDGLLHAGVSNANLTVLHVEGIEAARAVHGMAAGDGLLRHVVGAVIGALRATDLVGLLDDNDVAVLMADCPIAEAREKLVEIGRRIQDSPFLWMGQPLHCEVRTGLRRLSAGESAEQAIAAADRDRRGAEG
ncbi:MAG: GGDEF domain-containing protein [Solirubrobacterales bacterium]